MKQIIKMKQVKTTPGTVVYKVLIDLDTPDDPIAKGIYLTKAALSYPYPSNITVTVEAE